MARHATLQPTDTVTVAEAREAVEQATRFLQERIDTLNAQVNDLVAERDRLRDELDAQDLEAYAVANMVNDLDHAIAFGHTDRVADILAGNPYNMLTRNMIQVSLTA